MYFMIESEAQKGSSLVSEAPAVIYAALSPSNIGLDQLPATAVSPRNDRELSLNGLRLLPIEVEA